MKIYSSAQVNLNQSIHSKQQAEKPSLVTGKIAELSHDIDKVEISPAARELAASDIVNHAATYFGTTQINDSLNRVLSDQPSEVKEAVYGLIASNFITDVTGEEERAALLELGLAQAKYIADNYMKDGNAVEFMNTIHQIGAISKTRTVDPETQQIRYETPPQKPIGAPDDYINLTSMMQKYEPKTLENLKEAIASGKDWSSILINFAKNAATRKDWVQGYSQESTNQVSPSENRFGNASTISLTEFITDIKHVISTAQLENTRILNENIEAFMRTLQSSKTHSHS